MSLLFSKSRLLTPDGEPADESDRRERLVRVAEEAQNMRSKRGLDLSAKTTRVIQELTVVFGLIQRQGKE